MFGQSPASGSNGKPFVTTPARTAADVARIEGGGLVQVIVTNLVPLTFYVFLNDHAVDQVDVESLSVAIDAVNLAEPVVRATLARYVTSVSGERTIQHQELFPSTVEVVAMGRRICVACASLNSLDGLWISLGLKGDGTSSEITGARALQILLTEGLLDARITWSDGQMETLLPQ